MIYIIMALVAGINIIISNSINAALGKRIGLLSNALVFYTIALFTSAAAFMLFSNGEPLRTEHAINIPYYVYIGTLIPIVTLFLNTYSMQKFSVVNYVLFTYIAEIITAVLIDYFINGIIQLPKIIGTVFMIAGIYADNKIIQSDKRSKEGIE
ncbi:MAG: hypothetical protein GYA50_05295 [Eubacteriaceae bacterium]|nr:hypothetical protein [Eubacteriaceae bacterium]